MRKYSRIFWLSLLYLAFSACSNVPIARESPTPVATPALTAQIIAPNNIASLKEVTRLTTDNTGPVAALKLMPDSQTLFAAYAREGKLRQWRLADGSLLRTLDVHPFGLGGAAFDSVGKLLATGAGAEWETRRLEDEYLGWQVWDIQAGTVLAQFDKTYDSVLTRNLVPGILLSPDGHWVLMIHASADWELASLKKLDIHGTTTRQMSGVYINFAREPEEDDFDVIAFDAQGEFFAAADESGKVAVYPFRPPAYPEQAYAVIEKPSRLGPRPLALAFDPRRRWLAGIRGTQLIVWNLQSPRYERQLVASVGDVSGLTASLAFDPSSNLLGVGTANGWQVWNVTDKQRVAQGTGQVYAVTFSPDGRLFAWGDANGVVHLWGVLEK